MSATLHSRIPLIAAQLQPSVAEALKIGAEAIADDAKSRVPVDSGDLRDAIHVERQASGGVYANQAVIAGDDNVFYGHLVENGTVKTPARPFLIPALEAQKADVEKLVGDALERL